LNSGGRKIRTVRGTILNLADTRFTGARRHNFLTDYALLVYSLSFPIQYQYSFANPDDPLTTSQNTDQNYFNVGWGGVRESTLPKALEPNPSTGNMEYSNVDTIDYIPLCQWGSTWKDAEGKTHGHDFPGGPAGRGEFKELKDVGGYTTFVDDRLLINVANFVAPWEPWCRKGTDPTCSNPTTCMARKCTDDQVNNKGYVRVQLKVYPQEGPDCIRHSTFEGRPVLQCNMRDPNFGKTFVYASLYDECTPW